MRLVAAALALAALGGAVWNQYRTSAHERALAAVASDVAGRPVGVRCQGLPSELLDVGWTAGEVHFDAEGRPADETRLDRQVCRDLARLREAAAAPSFACVRRAAGCEREIGRIAYAPHQLAHEAWHLRGEVDEARAECFALQTTAFVASRLGLDHRAAAAVASWNLVVAYPSLPTRYRTAGCRDGTPLDLRPGDPRWP